MKKAILLMCLLLLGTNAFGAEGMRVRASSGAQVGPTVSMTTTLAGGWTVIPFTNSDAEYDTDTYIDTNQFIVPSDGIYLVTVHGFFASSIADRLDFAYTINGGSLIGFFHVDIAAGGVGSHGNASFQKQLSAGDRVSLYVLTNLSGSEINQIEIGISRH